jgi:hypothetical protein
MQVLRHDGMRKITEANQFSRQLHIAQRCVLRGRLHHLLSMGMGADVACV